MKGTENMHDNQLNFRIGDLSLRTVLQGKDTRLEIIKWIDINVSCFTLAYWIENKKGEEADLLFVGNRPFADDVNHEHFWMLAKIGKDLHDRVIKVDDE